jgi:hypothetical protein
MNGLNRGTFEKHTNALIGHAPMPAEHWRLWITELWGNELGQKEKGNGKRTINSCIFLLGIHITERILSSRQTGHTDMPLL